MGCRVYYGANWLAPTYDRGEMGKLIRRAIPKLRRFRKNNPFDAIAFCGYSGAGIASILSWEMNIPLICVRKNKSHDLNLVFGLISTRRYIIIDDMICSGNTIRRIIKRVQRFKYPRRMGDKYGVVDYKNPELVAIFLYNFLPKFFSNLGDYPVGFPDQLKKVPVLSL